MRRCVGGVTPSSGPGAPGSEPLCSTPTQMTWRCAASWYALTKLLSAVRVPDILVMSAAQRRQPLVRDPSQVIPGVRDPYQGYESCFFFSASRIRRLRCASVVGAVDLGDVDGVGDVSEVRLDVPCCCASVCVCVCQHSPCWMWPYIIHACYPPLLCALPNFLLRQNFSSAPSTCWAKITS